MRLIEYINDLAAKGKHHFTLTEVETTLGVSHKAILASLKRLERKNEIASPHRGFYVIIPRNYRSIGCLPPEQFVHQLMTFLGEPYYVALLSAAQFYAAAHQQPQIFQVMTRKNLPMIQCGNVRVRFIAKKNLEETPLKTHNTPRGVINLSTPEATAIDLIMYPRRSGGLNNIATVLSELVEEMNLNKFRNLLNDIATPYKQRLGYLFSLIGADLYADLIEQHLKQEPLQVTPLTPSKKMTGTARDQKWKIAVNAKVEPDL